MLYGGGDYHIISPFHLPCVCDVQSISFEILSHGRIPFSRFFLLEVESNAIRFGSSTDAATDSVSLFISGENVSLLVHFNFNPNVCTQFPDCGMFSAFLLSLFHLRLSFFLSSADTFSFFFCLNFDRKILSYASS